MPERGRESKDTSKAASSKNRPAASKARGSKPGQPGKPANPATADGETSPPKRRAAEGKPGGGTPSPRLVHRDGVAYLDEYDIPVWRLEMARRAGPGPDALIAAFPGLTLQGLKLAFAYARRHKAEFDPLIQRHSGADVPSEDEGDGDEDEAASEAELDALFTEYAEVFRRLAQ